MSIVLVTGGSGSILTYCILQLLAALKDPAVKQILPDLGIVKNATSQKARRVLGCSPGSREEALIATAESLIRYGLLKDSGKGK